jgi:hypothetical protein
MTRSDDSPPGPIELLESARAKYMLALGRVHHGPPELALLSLHGSLEDALRGYALRQRLAAAADPFPQLLDALAADSQAHLNPAEADIIRRMHRLRARVAHGEQLTLAVGTIDAYHRLAARLLPQFGVLVVGPEDAGATTMPQVEAESPPPRRHFDDVEPIPPRHGPDGGRPTTRLPRPPRERTVYPDDEPARYAARPRRGPAQPAQPGGFGPFESQIDRIQRAQPWLLPLLIIVSVLLIGAAVTISLQQIRAARALLTPTATATTFVPVVTPVPPRPSADSGAQVNGVVPAMVTPTVVATATPTATPGALAAGTNARVNSQIQLNLRERPGVDPTIPILLALDPGTEVLVVEGPTQTDGFSWWKVRVANIEGWCAGDYLQPEH